MTGNERRAELALCLVGLTLALAAFASPVPFVLSAPATVLSLVLVVRSLRRMRATP